MLHRQLDVELYVVLNSLDSCGKANTHITAKSLGKEKPYLYGNTHYFRNLKKHGLSTVYFMMAKFFINKIFLKTIFNYEKESITNW